MSGVAQVLAEIEAAGVVVRLDDGKVQIVFADQVQRQQLAHQLVFLRNRRDEVVDWLKSRAAIPPMPPGVRLVEWALKRPPIAIETCAVVTDAFLFARTTIEQLRSALSCPKRWVGWSIPQLVQRLAQVGVLVTIDQETDRLGPK
jgi:hypothetical protein